MAEKSWQPTAEIWADAPYWAVWCVGNQMGGLEFHRDEPTLSTRFGWRSAGQNADYKRFSSHDLPLGIDWRLAKWRRPEMEK